MKVDGVLHHVVFGPVESRRYGRSLGINPLPAGLKICSFNCPYCECGWTDVSESRALEPASFPGVDEIEEVLRAVLEEVARTGPPLDNLTVCGNGEPTLHPEFPRLVDRLLAARAELAPRAGVIVLANSTNLERPEIVAALSRLDEQVMKLDAGTPELFRLLAAPVAPVDLDAVCARLKELPRVVIQSMFVQGRIDNTGAVAVAAWLARLREIRPLRVQLYSLDRRPADPRLERVPPETLHAIARQIAEAGLTAEVFS